MRTAAWYGDTVLEPAFPDNWEVRILRPSTLPRLPDDAIRHAIENPIGQPPLRQLAKGKQRPVVVIDDCNRPTPTDRILPYILNCFADPARVTIVVATGTHGPPMPAALERKTGRVPARVLVHNPHQGLNQAVAASDCVLGIGGIYPNHTAGFGGGSKLALGILGFRQIESLHYRHGGAHWGEDPGNSFRRELDDIARSLGLSTIVSAQVSADRDLVRVVSGDHFRYHAGEVAFAREAFTVSEPAAADVVISNAYPNDLSLTFARMKGMTPLTRCAPGVSRIAIAACPEGMGFHGLFPLSGTGGGRRLQVAWRKVTVLGPRGLALKIAAKFRRSNPQPRRNGVWLYRPGDHQTQLPESVGDTRISGSWRGIVQAVSAEHPGKSRLKVLVYPCAPLQILVPSPIDGEPENEVLPELAQNLQTY